DLTRIPRVARLTRVPAARIVLVLEASSAPAPAVSIGPTERVPCDARLGNTTSHVIDGARLARLLAVSRRRAADEEEGTHAGTGSPDGAVSRGPHALDGRGMARRAGRGRGRARPRGISGVQA